MRIKEYPTDELLMIANNVTGEYSDKQIRQAKLELYNRGVNDEVIADIMEEKEEAFMKSWMLPHVQKKHKSTSVMRRTETSAINGGKC